MMNNNLNKKRERDDKSIVVSLGKLENGYYYHGDTLTERSKIKIPILEMNNRGDPFHDAPGKVQENLDLKKEKSEKGSKNHIGLSNPIAHDEIKIESNAGNGNNWNNIGGSSTSPKQGEVYIQSNQVEEIPQIAKLADKAYKDNIVIPSCSSWFKFENIHEIEMKSLPEFFCGKFPSKNPETYKEYRNFIVNLYRENQNSYLTATGK